MLVGVRKLLHPAVFRSGLDRCLSRRSVPNLRELRAPALAEAGLVEPDVKTNNDDEPGFLHRDSKNLPQRPVKSDRRYLLVATERATRSVFMPKVSGKPRFGVCCKALNMGHRLCSPRHPQTKGMVGRFTGNVSDAVIRTRLASAAELVATLTHCVKAYNHAKAAGCPVTWSRWAVPT